MSTLLEKFNKILIKSCNVFYQIEFYIGQGVKQTFLYSDIFFVFCIFWLKVDFKNFQ